MHESRESIVANERPTFFKGTIHPSVVRDEGRIAELDKRDRVMNVAVFHFKLMDIWRFLLKGI